jgi:hypothetical protein
VKREHTSKKPRGKGRPFRTGAANPRYRLAERWASTEQAQEGECEALPPRLTVVAEQRIPNPSDSPASKIQETRNAVCEHPPIQAIGPEALIHTLQAEIPRHNLTEFHDSPERLIGCSSMPRSHPPLSVSVLHQAPHE